jgi:hypothetical protein
LVEEAREGERAGRESGSSSIASLTPPSPSIVSSLGVY